MSQKDDKVLAEEAKARRSFLKKAAIVGATAPAAALLMSARPAAAQSQYGFQGTTTRDTRP